MNDFMIVGKMDGCNVHPMTHIDYGKPLVGDVVTQDGRTFYQVKGGEGNRGNGHLWLLSDVPDCLRKGMQQEVVL